MPTYRNFPITEKRRRYETLAASLFSERNAGFDAHWRELGEFLLPRRPRWWSGDRNRGDRRNQKIIDSTARYSIRTLSSGLHAGLTSPARPWMKLSTPDPELAKFGPVKEWLHEVTMRMLAVFSSSNLYNILPVVYGDLGCFGTAAMAILDDSRDLFRAYQYPIGSYALGQDARGLTTTFVRDYELTVRQVVEQFGVKENGRDIDWKHISRSVKDQWDQGQYEAAVKLVWIVKPNEDVNRERLESKYLPWSSCHYEVGERNSTDGGALVFLRESGFANFPIMAPRWDVTGEDSYGTDCPGMTALGDVKQLQIEQRRKGQAIDKMIDPPLVGPASLRNQKTSTLPGDVTFVDVREGMQGLKSIYEIRLDLSHLTEDIGQVQYRIQRAFYEDLFLMLQRMDERRGGQPPTAREIDERHEEKLIVLGPVLERTNDELLDPLVDRVFAMMEREGLLPDAPPDLNGVKLKVEYTSILAQAQKMIGVAGQDRLIQSAGAAAAIWPEVRHKVKAFKYIDNLADYLGVDPGLIRTDEEAEQIQQAEAEAAQKAQQAEQAVQMAEAAKKASETPLTGDTALTRMVSAGAKQAQAGGVM